MVVSLVWWFACGCGGDRFGVVAVRMVVGVMGGGEFLVWWLYVRL